MLPGEPGVGVTGPFRVDLPTSDDTRDLGARLARVLRAGDLVVLSGELGAGKTVLTQGLGAGLQVQGEVTSPTFVISRVHRSTVGGPDLVHVDAYRVATLAEVDDLDLDASVPESVTVVEWGTGKAEGLTADRLVVELVRVAGDAGGETRTGWVRGVGARWQAAAGELQRAAGGGGAVA